MECFTIGKYKIDHWFVSHKSNGFVIHSIDPYSSGNNWINQSKNLVFDDNKCHLTENLMNIKGNSVQWRSQMHPSTKKLDNSCRSIKIRLPFCHHIIEFHTIYLIIYFSLGFSPFFYVYFFLWLSQCLNTNQSHQLFYYKL